MLDSHWVGWFMNCELGISKQYVKSRPQYVISRGVWKRFLIAHIILPTPCYSNRSLYDICWSSEHLHKRKDVTNVSVTTTSLRVISIRPKKKFSVNKQKWREFIQVRHAPDNFWRKWLLVEVHCGRSRFRQKCVILVDKKRESKVKIFQQQ